MKGIATHYFDAAVLWLRRNPLPTVLIVYSVLFGIAALTTAYLACRINSGSPITRRGVF